MVGTSMGGVEALQAVLGSLRTESGVPVLVAQHSGASSWWLDKVLARTSPPDRFAATYGATFGVLPSHTLRT
ncbi:chemotaxis protein CheB [Geodermatophilus tzadiensis]|uniref:chemotaxis protein CheB n=1 Tax=Geodermatophilus tzadiensis TaxID=1137988 RepID=UPI0011B28511|nr:chemotaxis protein CheB [Geodermatophilus tzadiensis]